MWADEDCVDLLRKRKAFQGYDIFTSRVSVNQPEWMTVFLVTYLGCI